jgi:hypothetical protein
MWADEWLMIRACALAHGVDPYLIGAIRKAENGAPGREFGVLTQNAPTYAKQLESCCATVRNRMLEKPPRFRPRTLKNGIGRLCLNEDWIAWFATRWAPLDAANDPNGLNRNWTINVLGWYNRAPDEWAP